MTDHQPQEFDVVLGGQNLAPAGAMVLGGLESIKKRLADPAIEEKVAALSDALKYEQPGLDLVIQALNDQVYRVRQAAYLLLKERKEPFVEQALQEYSTNGYPPGKRFEIFVSMARMGGKLEVDTLMQVLEDDQNLSTYKLIDYVLSLVTTHEGKDQIKHYLFNGTQMQRNYAALYFKRLRVNDVLAEAVKQGCIDRVQAFSK